MPRHTHPRSTRRWAEPRRDHVSSRTANAIASALLDLRAEEPSHPRFATPRKATP